MLDSIKLWLMNVGLKQMGPSLVRAALAWVVAMLAAHAGMLETFGLIYDKASQTVTLHLDTLQTWLIGGGLGLVTAFLTAAQHHTAAAVTGKPQDGSHERAEDPPKKEEVQ